MRGGWGGGGRKGKVRGSEVRGKREGEKKGSSRVWFLLHERVAEETEV